MFGGTSLSAIFLVTWLVFLFPNGQLTHFDCLVLHVLCHGEDEGMHLLRGLIWNSHVDHVKFEVRRDSSVK
jgi:hypothetical protein